MARYKHIDTSPRFLTQVLYLCDRQGLIGREMFAIDGVKHPGQDQDPASRFLPGQG